MFNSIYRWERIELTGDKILISSDDNMDSSGSPIDNSNILTVSNVNFSDNGAGFYCRAINFSNSEVAYLRGKFYSFL